jgi:hypothetical protein
MGCIQTAITVAAVTKNVHMSWCWKAELVIYVYNPCQESRI